MSNSEPCDIAVFSSLLSEVYDRSCYYGTSCNNEAEYYFSFTQNQPTLEIACGTGRLTTRFLNYNNQLYGIEGSKPMFDVLQSRLPPQHSSQFILWNAQAIPYPVDNESFSCIIVPFSTFGLVHNGVRDPGENLLFKEFHRLLSRNGYVIINDYRIAPFDRKLIGTTDCEIVETHTHPIHGMVAEEQFNEYSIESNRLFTDQVIRHRRTRFFKEENGEILEEHRERIPIWDTLEFPVLGADAGFNYVKCDISDKWHSHRSAMHVFQKI